MESSVSSQKTSKIYSAPLSKLYKDDLNVQSELFEINIFNTVLHIAPGKSIAGDDGLVYFYVYAIKDERVVANLGVYELITDEQKELYDISTFDDLLLFDYYYTTPAKIKEFEIKGKNNIFDYIDTHLEIDSDKKKIVSLMNQFIAYIKAEKDALGDNYKLYYNVISILSTTIKTTGIPKETIDKLKEKCDSEKKKPLEQFKICLAILEPFYNVHFLFIDNGETVSNFRDKTPPQTFKPKHYIIVSTDQTFVSTSSTLKEPKKEEEDEDEKETEKEPEDEQDEVEEMVEPKSKLMSKTVSKADSKVEEIKLSAVEKAESKVEEPEPEAKAESKPKPKLVPRARVPKITKAESDEPKAEAKLSVIPETSKEVKESKSKLKTSLKSAPESKSEVKEAKSEKESKPEKESKKLKSSKDKPESKAENAAPSAPRKLKTKSSS
jgi:hypothetical protein